MARFVVDQLPAIFWTTDARLHFTCSLGAGLGGLGLGPNQLVGMSLFEFFETEDRRFPAIQAHLRALLGEMVPFQLAWGARTVAARVGPLRDGRGRTIGTIGVALDAPDVVPGITWNVALRGSLVG